MSKRAVVKTLGHDGMECIVIDGQHHHVKHLAPYRRGGDRIRDTFKALGFDATYIHRYPGLNEIHYEVTAA